METPFKARAPDDDLLANRRQTVESHERLDARYLGMDIGLAGNTITFRGARIDEPIDRSILRAREKIERQLRRGTRRSVSILDPLSKRTIARRAMNSTHVRFR